MATTILVQYTPAAADGCESYSKFGAASECPTVTDPVTATRRARSHL